MILDALKKANNSLNTTTKALCNEDLKSILNIHHFGLDEALSIANNGSKFSNPITYLKFKIIDTLKDFSFTKKILGEYFKTQLSLIDEAISNPLVRKEILKENIFKINNEEKHMKVEDFIDVIVLHAEGVKEGTDSVMTAMNVKNSTLGIKRKVMNPFNGIVMDLEMQHEQEHTMHGNRVFTMDKEFHDIHSLYIVQVMTNNNRSLNVSEDEKYNKLVNFEFTLYHELAHTSYNQMSKTKTDDRNLKEIHSDLSSIIKVIKNHNMSGSEALHLCEEIFKFRTESPSKSQYFDKVPTIREHFTELGIISFTSTLSKKMDKIKELKDSEIGDFVETFIQESMKKEINVLPVMENKEAFVKELLNNYIKDNIGSDVNRYMDMHVYSTVAKTKLFEKGQFKVKELYNEMTKENTYAKIKDNMFQNMMSNDVILTDIYLQNRQLNVGHHKVFIENVIKAMPAGRQLGIDVFEKFEDYKKDIQALKVISKNVNESSLKIKPN